MKKNPPLPIPMMDNKFSVKEFIKLHFIRYDELAKILGYNVAGNSIKSWLIGKFNPPENFEKICQKNKNKILKYSDDKLRNQVFEKYKKRKPQGFWERKETHKFALLWLCKKKNWNFPYGLYQLTKNDIIENNLDGLANYYKLSPTRIVTSILPEYNWRLWKFKMTNVRFWKDDDNKKKYLSWFEKKLKIRTIDDWYKISVKDFKNNYGSTLISTYFDGSIASVIKFLYPDKDIDFTKLNRVPPKHFDLSNYSDLRILIDNRAKELGFSFPNDYYKFSIKKNLKEIRLSILKEDTLCELLNKLYPNQKFYPWLFEKTANSFWEDHQNIKDYGHWLSKKLEFDSLEDWYDISNEIIYAYDGGGILSKKTIFDIAKISFPKYKWDVTKFDHKKFVSQKRLFKVLKKIFPNEKIQYNNRHPDIRNPKTNYPLELDCFIESKMIAFEYQGEQHYNEVKRFFHKSKVKGKSFDDSIYRDKIKKKRCKELGINLIEINSNNWDFSEKGLRKIINEKSIK